MKKQILKGLVLLGCCLLALSACSQKDNTPVHYLYILILMRQN